MTGVFSISSNSDERNTVYSHPWDSGFIKWGVGVCGCPIAVPIII